MKPKVRSVPIVSPRRPRAARPLGAQHALAGGCGSIQSLPARPCLGLVVRRPSATALHHLAGLHPCCPFPPPALHRHNIQTQTTASSPLSHDTRRCGAGVKTTPSANTPTLAPVPLSAAQVWRGPRRPRGHVVSLSSDPSSRQRSCLAGLHGLQFQSRIRPYGSIPAAAISLLERTIFSRRTRDGNGNATRRSWPKETTRRQPWTPSRPSIRPTRVTRKIP